MAGLVLGIDAVDIDKMRRMIELSPDDFGRFGWTDSERVYCNNRPDRYASRWAVKEAVAKALGCGFAGAPPDQIEVIGAEDRPPRLLLHGRALSVSEETGIVDWTISITRTRPGHSGGRWNTKGLKNARFQLRARERSASCCSTPSRGSGSPWPHARG
ncbi:MAG: Holo-[acyl-carrier protein] synthase, partial [Planctomycetaceae bacterium]|nr:Holo-[acyl-carrier protein] synthase [Planctomycetaceae bacterium]